MNKILIFAAALALFGCSKAEPKTDPKADKEAVEKIRDSFTEAFNANDPVKVASVYSENAVMMNNGQPTAQGRAAIAETNKKLFDQFKGRITLSPQNTKVSGDLAFDEGTFATVMTPKAGGGAEHVCPANIAAEKTNEIQKLALGAFRAAGLQVYGRVDVILPDNGPGTVLEINTIPGMTEASLLPEAAAVAGISYTDLCARIITLSQVRQRDARARARTEDQR